MIRYSKNFVPATLCALVMTGCTIFPVPETPRVMDFAPAPLTLGRAGDQQPYSLRVDTPVASEPINSTRILAKPEATEFRIYGGVRWRDTAPVIMRDAITAALRRSQGFERVITDVSPAEADLTMVTELLAFQSQPGANHSDVVIRLYSEIMENRSRRTACSQVFDIKTSAASNRLDDVIIAFDGAGQRMVSELALWASACEGLSADPKVENEWP
ncbi:ABC-type transport auxiliary lipoprotein family protein [Marinobacter sp. ELB17]|uniref:ABC-type transport auxiliary lipoprotein family protein n=1 Tax=Marinobacter sp. ELB17 TaxID=270374 RepID=UPI0000F39BEF|nr:ABC-type transport auxiliary lipoprotein family protein [Marinobacter sp. ELB17]EAZ99817.1 lipoprotein, putative [Marinobacter sp. ELB17]